MKDKKLLRAIEGAKKGDAASFDTLMELRGENLLYIALKLMKDQKDGEDAAQEAALLIKEKISTLNNAEHFDTWMYRIVFNVCMGAKREMKDLFSDIDLEKQEVSLLEDRSDFLPEKYVERESKRSEVMAALDKLPQSYRMCMLMYYFEEMNYTEIAEVMGVKQQDVANMLHRAKKKLRIHLGEPAEETIIHEPVKSIFAKGVGLSSLPAASLPAMGQMFALDQSQLINSEAFTRFKQSVMAASSTGTVAAGASAVTAAAATGSLLKPLIAGICAVAIAAGGIAAAVGGLPGSSQANGSNQAGQGTPPALEETGTTEKPLTSVVDEGTARRLEGFAGGGYNRSAWDAAVTELGLTYQGHFLANGYRYTTYTRTTPDQGRITIIERSNDGGSTEIAYRVEAPNAAVPEGIENVKAFDAWRN